MKDTDEMCLMNDTVEMGRCLSCLSSDAVSGDEGYVYTSKIPVQSIVSSISLVNVKLLHRSPKLIHIHILLFHPAISHSSV
jgi:hypothetical protein